MIEVNKMETLLKRSQVEEICGISRSHIYNLMRAGAFPEPLAISSMAVRWRQSEIEDWIETRQRATGERTPQEVVA